jgi:hypothetical protein
VERTDATPAIVVDETHRSFVPTVLSEKAPPENCGDDVVTISKYICFDNKIFANNALDRVSSAINQRLQILDDCCGEGPNHGP